MLVEQLEVVKAPALGKIQAASCGIGKGLRLCSDLSEAQCSMRDPPRLSSIQESLSNAMGTQSCHAVSQAINQLQLNLEWTCGAVEVVEAPALGHLDVQLEQGWWAGRPASALPLQNGFAHPRGAQQAGSHGRDASSPNSHVGSAGLTFKCVKPQCLSLLLKTCLLLFRSKAAFDNETSCHDALC